MELITKIKNGGYDESFTRLYGRNIVDVRKRYIENIENFNKLFGFKERTCKRELIMFSAPGRTEIGGNHTDHQRGCVLAAAVSLDIIAVAAKNNDNIIRIKSAGHGMAQVDLSELEPLSNETGRSPALIRGIAARFKKIGYNIGGFDAHTTSDVLKGSGLSSSAAFEVAVCGLMNHLYNDGKMGDVETAIVSQYAENVYFNKPCGLMDQMACSVGGFVGIDFADPSDPVIEKVDFDFASSGHSLCIVDTGGSHADLTDEYASIPAEMKQIAAFFGKGFLRKVAENDFYANIGGLRKKCSDRAILRGMHFFADNARAVNEKTALQNGDFDEFLRLINESGLSSQSYLQNVFATSNPAEQGLSLALSLTARILNGRGAYRVHGGGFAGTIQAFVPDDLLNRYKSAIEKVFGNGACYVLSVRPVGGVKVLANNNYN